MTATGQVILVDETDHPLGTADKMTAHEQGLCHRAFSVFVFRGENDARELLLQQRASDKYHSAGLWTNTCCSHPLPGEDIFAAGRRRLKEEMGIDLPLQRAGQFHYVAQFENGMTENEIDHVLTGVMENNVDLPVWNPQEVQAVRWIKISALEKEMQEHPENFTVWLKQALEIAVLSPVVPH